jgi:hypothetical protein
LGFRGKKGGGVGAASRDPTVQAVRQWIARFSRYEESYIEPLQVCEGGGGGVVGDKR